MKKKTNYLNHFFYWLTTGLIISVISHLAIEVLQRAGFTGMWLPLPVFLLGTGILFVLYTLLSALLGSSTLGAVGLFVTALTLGISNRVKIHYRAEPIFPNEFAIVKEVPFLVEMIGWFYTLLILITVSLVLLLTIYVYRTKLKPKKEGVSKRVEWSARIAGILLAGGALFFISQFQKPDHALREVYADYTHWTFDNQLEDYQRNGFIAGFLASIAAEPMEAPPDYSKERIQELAEKYQKRATEWNKNKGRAKEDVNILFVMNESFSDPFNLEGLDSNQDPLPHFRSLAEENLSGKVLSPTFGGGTNANEFQALTGFSLETFNPQITSPYTQLTDRIGTYPNIVRKLKHVDYQTTAIHPYNKDFFKRDEVYGKMGFDQFLHEEKMEHQETLTEEHLFISDAAAYKEALDVLNATDQTDFIHVVTMQNHTPYSEKYEAVAFEVSGSGNEEEANGYFQDLANSDRALGELIAEMDQHPEPILLFFWGDHLPGLYRGEIRTDNSDFRLRQTPFLVYSNRDPIQGHIENTSPVYFPNWLHQWLELEVSAFDALLMQLEEVLPMMDDGLYLENDELLTSREELQPETLDVLEEYTLILYDMTTGQQYAQDLGFFQ